MEIPHKPAARHASSPPVLELDDVTVIKGRTRVLDGVSLVVRAGQHTAVLGANGAGKSSLIRVLTHEERPVSRDDGRPSVRVFGEARWNVFDLRTKLGVVSAEMHHGFVEGNTAGRIRGLDAVLSGFFASRGVVRYGVVTPTMRRLALDALTRMGGGHLADKALHEMSSGEARRVLLARALVADPWALVLDEPTTGLDLVGRHRFMERVRSVARAGTTLVLVTHHVDEIVPEVEQVVLLAEGRVLAVGATRDVLTGPSLSVVFGAPVVVDQQGDYYRARVDV